MQGGDGEQGWGGGGGDPQKRHPSEDTAVAERTWSSGKVLQAESAANAKALRQEGLPGGHSGREREGGQTRPRWHPRAGTELPLALPLS